MAESTWITVVGKLGDFTKLGHFSTNLQGVITVIQELNLQLVTVNLGKL